MPEDIPRWLNSGQVLAKKPPSENGTFRGAQQTTKTTTSFKKSCNRDLEKPNRVRKHLGLKRCEKTEPSSMIYTTLAVLLSIALFFLFGFRVRVAETRFLIKGRRMLIDLVEKVTFHDSTWFDSG
jgi:hypothetical protein